MLNYILLFIAIYIISFFSLFYIDWSFYHNDDKNFKTMIKYMHWVEFTPIANTLILVLLLGFLGIAFLFIYTMGFVRFLEQKILRKNKI